MECCFRYMHKGRAKGYLECLNPALIDAIKKRINALRFANASTRGEYRSQVDSCES